MHSYLEKSLTNIGTAIQTPGDVSDIILPVMITSVTLNIMFLAAFLFIVVAFIIKARINSGTVAVYSLVYCTMRSKLSSPMIIFDC